MKRARNLIAAAIKLNPDAHFGREKYQLKLMEWIISATKKKEFPSLSSIADQEMTKDRAQKAVTGLTGLIVLGDAWQSVDVFFMH